MPNQNAFKMPEGRFVKCTEIVETTLLVKLNAREYDF